MKRTARDLSILICLWLASPPAFAGQWLQECESAIKESKTQADQAYQSYKSSDASRLATGSATSTHDQHNNAINLKGKIDAAKAELDKDIAQCQQAQKSCESKCDQQQQLAKAKSMEQPPNQQTIEAGKDAGQIPQKKASDCTGYIQPRTQEMQAGRAPLDQQSNDADKTRDQSQSGSPQSPQSPQSGDKSSDSGTSALASTGSTGTGASALNCVVAGGSRFSDCNATFVSKCTSSMTASECDTFTDRYCNLTSSTAQPALASATTNLVIDKRGEGLGSQYCGYANAYRYCQTPGRESCPSCLKVYAQASCQGIGCIAQTSTSLTQAQQAACPDDPSYLTPVTGTVATPTTNAVGTVSGTTTSSSGSSSLGLATTGTSSGLLAPASLSGMSGASTGGAGSGSTGGGAFGGSSSTGAASEKGTDSTREDGAGSIIGSTDVSGGGGAGGGAGGGEEAPWIAESERDLASLDLTRAFEGKKNEPARAVDGGAADVANGYGPSIFSLGSGAIKTFCVRGHIPSCD